MIRLKRLCRGSAGLFLLLLAVPSAAAAQDGPVFRPKHLTVSGGLAATGGVAIGDLTATIRPNTTGGPSFTLLRAESEIEAAAGGEVRVGVALTRRFAVEVGGGYARPRLGITISEDAESDGGALISERLSHYTVDVSALYQLSAVRLGRRMGPYVIGGVGYLRQLHEDRLLVETGRTLHLGGGVHYWLRGGDGRGRAWGARAEARVINRSGGIEFDGQRRTYPAFSLLAFAGF